MRRAAYDDSEAIKYIASNAGYVDYISENVSSMIRSGNLFVCVDGREMKGFFSLENIGQIWIGALRVHPGHRRSGIAMSMIRWAEEYTRNLSLCKMGALIEIHNVASINLFKSNGFVEKDRYFSIFGAPQVNNVRKYSKKGRTSGAYIVGLESYVQIIL
jgi:Sortase and related acyltransferases